MTGYNDHRPSLEDILEQVSATATHYKHRIMQISVSAYILGTSGFDRGYGEYEFIFDTGNSEKKKPAYNTKWPADIVLVYDENGKKVVEVIEVETRAIERYGKRTQNLKYKERKVNRAYSLRHLNLILKDADEVRFSVAMDASGVPDEDLYAQIKGFVDRFDSMGNGLRITEHNIYLLRKDITEFIPRREHTEKELVKKDMIKSLEELYAYGLGSVYRTISWQNARSTR